MLNQSSSSPIGSHTGGSPAGRALCLSSGALQAVPQWILLWMHLYFLYLHCWERPEATSAFIRPCSHFHFAYTGTSAGTGTCTGTGTGTGRCWGRWGGRIGPGPSPGGALSLDSPATRVVGGVPGSWSSLGCVSARGLPTGEHRVDSWYMSEYIWIYGIYGRDGTKRTTSLLLFSSRNILQSSTSLACHSNCTFVSASVCWCHVSG
jgi:hypothetical protein